MTTHAGGIGLRAATFVLAEPLPSDLKRGGELTLCESFTEKNTMKTNMNAIIREGSCP